MGQNCLDLGSEYEVAARGRIKQWGDSELVPCTEQAIAHAVKQHESELTIYSAEKVIAQLLIEMDQDFNIGLRAKAVSLCNHFISELAMIEDLAVTNQKDGLILIRQRLVASKQVNDTQPPETESNTIIDKISAIVRATMRKRLRHCLDDVG
jgi:hypothetical protein